MAGLTSSSLLDAWERGRDLHPIDRALRILAAARPDRPATGLATLSLGERDALLLTLREETFGTELACVADCPACDERLEFDLATDALRTPLPQPTAEMEHAGRRLSFRPLNSHDLAAIAGAGSAGEARVLLASRCLLDAQDIALSDELVEAIGERLAEIDPQSEILLDLACPACGEIWQLPFDIEAFLWREITAEATRLLNEVHTLARAYGWREADILALTPARRRVYVELVS